MLPLEVSRTRLSLWIYAAAGAAISASPEAVDPLFQRAEPVTILFLAAIALSIVAGMMMKPKVGHNQRDGRLPQLVKRGTVGPYIIGNRIVDGKPLWVGRRFTREEKFKGGKKGGKGGGAGKQIIYYEDAVHFMALGPWNKLNQIRQGDDTVIFQGPITPNDTPSGSTLQDVNGNQFKIYWGERTQPINADLSGDDALGVASRFPYHCYVHWVKRRLGVSAVWPMLDYDGEATCIGSTLPGSPCSFGETAPGARDGGMNGAHIIYQVATGSFPHGAGMDPHKLDFGSLKALGAKLQSERLPQNLLISNGTSVADIFDDLLADAGVLMPQEGHVLVFVPMRPVLDPPTLDDRVVVIPRTEFETNHGANTDSLLIFVYPDWASIFHDTDLQTRDDATARAQRNRNNRTLNLPTITNKDTAAMVAERRKLLFFADGNQVSLKVMHTARRLVAGHVVIVPDVGEVRITAVERVSTSAVANITATVNQYALAGSGWTVAGGGSSGGNTPPSADDLFKPLESPHDFVGANLRLSVVRYRLDGVAFPAMIWVSTNGSTYEPAGLQVSSAAAGVLTEALPVTGRQVIAQGPKITATTAAMNKVVDLSANQNGWMAGQQLALIDDEILFLRNVTAVTGGFRLDGLVRGRLSSLRGAHEIGTKVAIFGPEAIEALASVAWTPGMRLWVKSVPNGVDMSTIAPVIIDLAGKALGPPPVDNLGPLTYATGEDISFTWTTRIRRGTGTGAGELPYGSPIGAVVPFEGIFRIRVIDGVGNVKRTVLGVTSATWTYTEAMRTTDLLEGHDFVVQVTHIKDSFGGYPTPFLVQHV